MITTIDKSQFYQSFLQSIIKYFKELQITDHSTNKFKDLYDVGIVYEWKDFEAKMGNKKGVLYVEQIAPITEEQRSGSKIFLSEYNATTRTDAVGSTISTDINLRLQTNTNEKNKTGLKDLEVFKGMMYKALESEVIPVYNFTTSTPTATSLKIKWHNQFVSCANVSLPYTEPQQCIFTVPIWCDLYKLETHNRVDDYVINLIKYEEGN